jgi:hypothetical protein
MRLYFAVYFIGRALKVKRFLHETRRFIVVYKKGRVNGNTCALRLCQKTAIKFGFTTLQQFVVHCLAFLLGRVLAHCILVDMYTNSWAKSCFTIPLPFNRYRSYRVAAWTSFAKGPAQKVGVRILYFVCAKQHTAHKPPCHQQSFM